MKYDNPLKKDLAQEFKDMLGDQMIPVDHLLNNLHQRLTEVEKLREEMYRELGKLREETK